jgi:hypothetical protein
MRINKNARHAMPMTGFYFLELFAFIETWNLYPSFY